MPTIAIQFFCKFIVLQHEIKVVLIRIMNRVCIYHCISKQFILSIENGSHTSLIIQDVIQIIAQALEILRVREIMAMIPGKE